jgi:hypothetical protein
MAMAESDDVWLRTDLEHEAVASLRFCRRQLEAAASDSYEMKWAALAVTEALSAFVVKTYRSVDLLYWDARTRREMVAYEAGERPLPPAPSEVWLPPFVKLCERLRDEHGWAVDAEQWDLIEELGSVRNDFVHFKPKGWSLAIAGLRASIAVSLDGIAHVVEREPGAFLWYDEALRDQARDDLATARAPAAG